MVLALVATGAGARAAAVVGLRAAAGLVLLARWWSTVGGRMVVGFSTLFLFSRGALGGWVSLLVFCRCFQLIGDFVFNHFLCHCLSSIQSSSALITQLKNTILAQEKMLVLCSNSK